MGKVYDALKISGCYDDEANAADVGTAHPGQTVAHAEPESISYLDYLLNGIPVVEAVPATTPSLPAPAPAKQVIDVPRPASESGRLDPHLVAFSGSDRSAVEQYNRLAVGLISAATGRSLKRVLVGSPARLDGRTTVALNLAHTLARARKKVLLVDADLLRPSITRMLGVSADLGLGDIFRWRNPGAALLSAPRFGFDLLPTRAAARNSAEILSSRAFKLAIDILEPHYDFILFDTPPLLEAGDCSLLMRSADTMVMVIARARLKTAQLAKTVEAFKPEDIFGVVLNRARPISNWKSALAGQ